MSALRLELGGVDLVGANGGYDSFSFGTLADDFDFGEPGSIETVVATLMGDGSRTDTTRYENREITFRVVVEAPDAGGLANGEALLDSVIGRRTTLLWQPPDDFGPATVFDVETSRKRFLFSDLDEVRNVKQRTFQVTLVCLPFGRSEDPVTIGSEFVSDEVTISDDCESTSGWSCFNGNSGTFTVDSTPGNFATGTGAVKLVATPYPYDPPNFVGPGGVAATAAYVRKTGLSIDASGGGYLVMRVKGEWRVAIDSVEITTSGGGTQNPGSAIMQADEDGFTRYSWPVPHASTVTAWQGKVSQNKVSVFGAQPPNPAFWFDSIGLADAAAENQSLTSFDVVGSMRSEGTFEISAPAGLGDVLLYTCPDLGDGFRPDLRRWQTSGSTVVDAAAVTGSYVLLSAGGTVLEAPASIFRPGAYGVLARIDDGNYVEVTAQVTLDGVPIGPSQTVTSPPQSATDYTVVRVGVLDLPPLTVDPASGAVVRFEVEGNARLDELLVFPLEDAALTWVECGSGSPSASVASRLWIDSPSPTQPRGARLVGNDEGRLDARYVLPRSAGRHLLYSGRMLAYLLTSAAGGAALQVTYFPKAHTNNAYQAS